MDLECREHCARPRAFQQYDRNRWLRYLKAFDSRILVSDPHIDHKSTDNVILAANLEDLLRKSAIVSLHVSLSDTTQRFFGKEQFSRMNAGAEFVNTARGELIDERALLDALRSGHLAGAVLDVLCEESSNGMIHHPLVAYAREHDNLIITRNIGGCTVESMEKTQPFLAEKLCASVRQINLK